MKKVKALPVKEIPKAPELPSISCQLNSNGPITVGQELTLACPTDGTSLTSVSSIKFENGDTAQPYALDFADSPVVNGNNIVQKVTSYKVGSHNLDRLWLSIDGKKFQLSPLNLNVQSVIQTQQGQPTPTPFPIYDPEKVPAPWWWWGIWFFLLALVIGFFTWQLIKWLKERKKNKELAPEREKTPREKFQDRLRKLESRGFHQRGEYKAFALELTSILKSAIGAQLQFPAEDMTSEEVLATIEKRNRGFFDLAGVSLQKIFFELDQIKFAKSETTTEKCFTLLDSSMKIGVVLFGEAS